MTATHPDTIWAAQYGNTIAAENNPGSLDGDGMEYISRAAHDAAVSAARKEGMLEAAGFCHWNAVGLNPRHGYIVDPWTEEQGGSHPGHAYAKALKEKAETIP